MEYLRVFMYLVWIGVVLFMLYSENMQNTTFSPLHPNISLHILHTVLYTFPKVLTRRICLTIKSFFSWRSFNLFS